MGVVSLFATCLGDIFLRAEVDDAETLVRANGDEVLRVDGVCCGQPAFNAGHRRAAERVSRAALRALPGGVPVVVPSGSCTAMLHRLGVDAHELSSFLEPRATGALAGRTVAYHDSCHMLRELGIAQPPRALLEAAGARIVPLRRPDLCCGFGGTFSARQPELSAAMGDEKLADAAGAGADALVTADPGCLLHLRRRSAGPPVVHLASALVRGLP